MLNCSCLGTETRSEYCHNPVKPPLATFISNGFNKNETDHFISTIFTARAEECQKTK